MIGLFAETPVVSCPTGQELRWKARVNIGFESLAERILEDVDLTTCKYKCIREKSFVCRMFEYRKATKICRMVSSMKNMVAQGLKESTGSVLYESTCESTKKSAPTSEWTFKQCFLHYHC